MEQLAEQYPNDFLFGRYRQEVTHFDGKLYAFGGGKIDGDAYGFDSVMKLKISFFFNFYIYKDLF